MANLIESLRRIEDEGKPLTYRVKLKEYLSLVNKSFSAAPDTDPLKHAKNKLEHSKIFDLLGDVVDLTPQDTEVFVCPDPSDPNTEADLARVMVAWEIQGNDDINFRRCLVISSSREGDGITVFSGRIKVEEPMNSVLKLLPNIENFMQGEATFIDHMSQGQWRNEKVMVSVIADALHKAGIRAPKINQT